MSLSEIDRPTDRPDPYFQFRLTVSHEHRADFQTIIENYSKDWAYCTHFPDEMESACKKEHFHAVFRDFTVKLVDSFRKAIKKRFADISGNALCAGCWKENHVSKAIGYFKHDEHAEIIHSGQPYWGEYVETEPAFVKGGPKKVLKESMSHPVLTYANLLKQALKYQKDKCPTLRTLDCVIEHMVNEANWWPSRELLTNGVPSETHQRFSDLLSTKRTRLSFWLPHERSEKKLEWVDRPAAGWYPTGVSSSGPGDSKRLVCEKDFRVPSSI